ncbi:MAG: hypothetical protein EHM55_00140 [Acidobacteria bacterium]|nr:MAG: hypothetical protein EHM55_00140 [Acidobacteriota bacterium]
MHVEINEVSSTVRAIDGDAPLSPQAMQRIVEAVLRALKSGNDHEAKAAAERRVTGGVSAERDEES